MVDAVIARRSLLIGLGSLIAAPAIVKAEHIMKVRTPIVLRQAKSTPQPEEIKPLLGEIRHFYEAVPESQVTGRFDFGRMTAIVKRKIFDGGEWLDMDSEPGCETWNKLVRMIHEHAATS